MDRRAAQEVLHIRDWLGRVEEIVRRRKQVYLDDDLLQEAGDSLMMKLGEAAKRLSRLQVQAPDGVDWALAVANRNLVIHQYDAVNRALIWLTLSRDLPSWTVSMIALVTEAEAAIQVDQAPVDPSGRPRSTR